MASTHASEIPTRVNGDVAEASWWNILKDAILGFTGSSGFRVDSFDLNGVQASPADITGASFDQADAKIFSFRYFLRRTYSGRDPEYASGWMRVFYNEATSSWEISDDDVVQAGTNSLFSNFGLSVLTTAGVGQFRYTSTDPDTTQTFQITIYGGGEL